LLKTIHFLRDSETVFWDQRWLLRSSLSLTDYSDAIYSR
jgi:hypothetical protein